MMLNLKHLLVMVFVLLSVNLMAQTSISSTGIEYSENDKQFSISRTNTNNAQLTDYTWKDSKGNVYPIYISSSGSCYIIKTSSKTGKEYKQYMKKEISIQICKELNVEYKNKKR